MKYIIEFLFTIKMLYQLMCNHCLTLEEAFDIIDKAFEQNGDLQCNECSRPWSVYDRRMLVRKRCELSRSWLSSFEL